jgi:hypothetical protein
MRASIMRDVQCEQRGRSIAVKDCWDEFTMLPLGGSIYRLSVTDGCRWLGGDAASMRLGFRSRWSIPLTFQKN